MQPIKKVGIKNYYFYYCRFVFVKNCPKIEQSNRFVEMNKMPNFREI